MLAGGRGINSVPLWEHQPHGDHSEILGRFFPEFIFSVLLS